MTFSSTETMVRKQWHFPQLKHWWPRFMKAYGVITPALCWCLETVFISALVFNLSNPNEPLYEMIKIVLDKTNGLKNSNLSWIIPAGWCSILIIWKFACLDQAPSFNFSSVQTHNQHIWQLNKCDDIYRKIQSKHRKITLLFYRLFVWFLEYVGLKCTFIIRCRYKWGSMPSWKLNDS